MILDDWKLILITLAAGALLAAVDHLVGLSRLRIAHLIFSGMKYSTNPEFSTATRTNAAHDFPIMISTVTGTVW